MQKLCKDTSKVDGESGWMIEVKGSPRYREIRNEAKGKASRKDTGNTCICMATSLRHTVYHKHTKFLCYEMFMFKSFAQNYMWLGLPLTIFILRHFFKKMNASFPDSQISD